MDRNKIEESIIEMFGKFFNVEQPDRTMHFSELGGKSVDAMKLQIELRKQFGIKMDFRTIYKLGTIEAMGQYILENAVVEN